MRRSNKLEVIKFRGAAEVLSDPFIFRWTVNEAGYEWLAGADGKLRLFPRHMTGVGIRHYMPEPGLFREFAALKPRRDSIQEFAGRHGDLFDRWDIAHTLVQGGRFVGGTSLDTWKIKIGDMREIVSIWDQIEGENLAELSKIIVRSDKEICYVRGLTNITLAREGELSRFNPKDVLLPARCALQLEINKRLADTETPTLVVPRLTWTPDYRQRIKFQPCNLLAEMWVQFAQVTTGVFRLKQCAVCDKYFQVGPGGKRPHTVTCSVKCRQQKSRNSK